MATRLLTAADEAAYATLYEQARVAPVNGLINFFPGGAAPLPGGLIHEWVTAPGYLSWGSFQGATLRGVITGRDNPYPFAPGAAWEMYIWVTLPSLSNAALATVSKELMTAFWTHLLGLGVMGWGMNVLQYPQRTEALFQRMINQGMPVETRELNGLRWRFVQMTPADALARLPGV